MKKIQIVINTAILLLSISALIGCTEVRSFTSDEKLLGTWKNTLLHSEIIMFFPDGTWASMGSHGTWTIEDEKLKITTETSSGKIEYVYDYKLTIDNKLTLNRSNGISKVYVKQ